MATTNSRTARAIATATATERKATRNGRANTTSYNITDRETGGLIATITTTSDEKAIRLAQIHLRTNKHNHATTKHADLWKPTPSGIPTKIAGYYRTAS